MNHDVRPVECIKFKVLNPVISGMVFTIVIPKIFPTIVPDFPPMIGFYMIIGTKNQGWFTNIKTP